MILKRLTQEEFPMFKKSLTVILTLIMALSLSSVTALAGGMEEDETLVLADKGPHFYMTNVAKLAQINPNFRTAIWTGDLLQAAVMSIPVHGEIGLEVHEKEDQLIFIVSGSGTIHAGPSRDDLNIHKSFSQGSGIFIPVGMWHNIYNGGSEPLKIFTVYAPPHHPHGTVHETKMIAEAEH